MSHTRTDTPCPHRSAGSAASGDPAHGRPGPGLPAGRWPGYGQCRLGAVEGLASEPASLAVGLLERAFETSWLAAVRWPGTTTDPSRAGQRRLVHLNQTRSTDGNWRI